MTEKRFKYYAFDGFEDNGKEMSPQEVEETLNKFQELSIEDYKKIERLEKENEQLKQKNKGLQSELHIFKEDVTHSNKIIDKLNDENEQLKSELKSLRKKYNDFSDAVDKRLKELIE